MKDFMILNHRIKCEMTFADLPNVVKISYETIFREKVENSDSEVKDMFYESTKHFKNKSPIAFNQFMKKKTGFFQQDNSKSILTNLDKQDEIC